MAEYEVVREIKNQCPKNQMRDIFFWEVETDDPEQYVRDYLNGRPVEMSVERGADGRVTVHATCDGLVQQFAFTPI